jgi:NAD-dependent deacetylase
MVDSEREAALKMVAEMIAEARRVVVFTGAGVSTESGIPDFRSPGGIWTKFDPDEFTIHRFIRSVETRRKQWEILFLGGVMTDARPNRAHRAIAELEKMGKLDCVITQNIDSLHVKAGNSPDTVFEVHGHARTVHCLDCLQSYSMEEIVRKNEKMKDIPVCRRCGGILKPDVVFFGEALPADIFEQAVDHASRADLFIVVGSSLVVYPAASMPQYAKEGGAKLAIINLTPTPCDRMADSVIHASAGETMEKILGSVRLLVSSSGGR